MAAILKLSASILSRYTVKAQQQDNQEVYQK